MNLEFLNAKSNGKDLTGIFTLECGHSNIFMLTGAIAGCYWCVECNDLKLAENFNLKTVFSEFKNS